MVHLLDWPGDEDTKNPTSRRGVCRSAIAKCLSCAPIRSPRTGSFFHDGVAGARKRDHGTMMRRVGSAVNGACPLSHDENHGLQTVTRKKPLMSAQKKAGLMRARL